MATVRHEWKRILEDHSFFVSFLSSVPTIRVGSAHYQDMARLDDNPWFRKLSMLCVPVRPCPMESAAEVLLLPDALDASLSEEPQMCIRKIHT